jgi:lipoprotein-releasing system ATP-binding protein
MPFFLNRKTFLKKSTIFEFPVPQAAALTAPRCGCGTLEIQKTKTMIIKAKAIEKSFGDLKVLRGIDFQVDRSEVVSIMGASGAGKSTLLQILGTLSTPDSGSLEIDGTDVLGLGSNALSAFRNKKIGFVFQFHHLLPEFNALENVMIPAFIAGRSDKDARAAATKLLEDVGLAERMEHKPSELSGGEQQRVAIARALVNSPAILFADEPSGNLDSKTKAEIHQLFFDLRERYGQTVVIVTHDPELAKMCDRTMFMRDGLFVER